MDNDLQDKLFEKFPKIFANKDLPTSESRMCDGIDCLDGWYQIIHNLCSELQNHSDLIGEQVTAFQVKEKFGGLRFYIDDDFEDPKITEIIAEYENMSETTCERCGCMTDGEKFTDIGKRIRTLCEKCNNFHEMDLREDLIKQAKPCPFCGGDDLRLITETNARKWDIYRVWCRDCSTRGPAIVDDPKMAIDDWNSAHKG